ncbi:nucleotide pyrophosphohydrolase [Vibrio sp. SS-MA-C1-2]|uniref:MazG nucleotide pyrophosphohydrolase domain-containing protein n=1 Tax=Vibrio sp. SS-MA-C1-2 TaxID=2908646 RepID=UPI001F28199F|nr:MazG nucleotide pyrophosphohydrolase domain-containing protein [Vibrio sp. SS-MA-C1-2]UJF20091.1 nucleotide pyrophosphohydrolase [Vibrio sp. SS-MA-C1-2]
MNDLNRLLEIARYKSTINQKDNWSNRSDIYLVEIKKEVDEVAEELPKNRRCYLEDELADVLWDYSNLLLALEEEVGIDPQSVIARACNKYQERVAALESGEGWKAVKERQQAKLALELAQES